MPGSLLLQERREAREALLRAGLTRLCHSWPAAVQLHQQLITTHIVSLKS